MLKHGRFEIPFSISAKLNLGKLYFLHTYTIDSEVDFGIANISVFQALHNILSPLRPEDPKETERQRRLDPTLLDQLIQSNFNSSILMPTVTVDTVRHLKEIISDTLATASNFLEGTNSEPAFQSTQVSMRLLLNDYRDPQSKSHTFAWCFLLIENFLIYVSPIL